MFNTQKTFFLILIFGFLFFSWEVFAQLPNCDLTGWNNDDCTIVIYYEDPIDGSGLDDCYYTVVSGTGDCPTDNGSWTKVCDSTCQGESCVCSVDVLIGSTGQCHDNGANACKICAKAVDEAGNTGYAEQSLDIDQNEPSTNFVSPTPSNQSWQKDNFNVKVMDSDIGGSGLKGGNGCEYLISDVNKGGVKSGTRPCGSYEFIVPVGSGVNYCSEDRTAPIGEATCHVETTAYDNAGNVKTVGRNFRIDYTPPEVGEIIPLVATQGTEETFSATLTDPIGQIAGCWLYIDGAFVKDADSISPIPCENGADCTVNVNYTFVLSGDYEMRFACVDLAGNYGWGDSVTVNVAGGGTPGAPIITDLYYFTSHCDTPTQECVSQFDCCLEPTTQDGCCLKFNVEATDSDGDDLNYTWDFGDSVGSSNEEDPHYHYDAADTYIVLVTVDDGTNYPSKGVTVTVNNPTLFVNLTANPSFGTDPLTDVSLRAIVSGSMYGLIDYYFDCNLADGDCTAGEPPYSCDHQALTQTTEDYTATSSCAYYLPTCAGDGESCGVPGDCCSGYCVDDVCCGTACEGSTCQRCDSHSVNGAGTCGYVSSSSEDPDNECGNDGCEKDDCTGDSYACQYFTSGQHGCDPNEVCDESGDCVTNCVVTLNEHAGTCDGVCSGTGRACVSVGWDADASNKEYITWNSTYGCHGTNGANLQCSSVLSNQTTVCWGAVINWTQCLCCKE